MLLDLFSVIFQLFHVNWLQIRGEFMSAELCNIGMFILDTTMNHLRKVQPNFIAHFEQNPPLCCRPKRCLTGRYGNEKFSGLCYCGAVMNSRADGTTWRDAEGTEVPSTDLPPATSQHHCLAINADTKDKTAISCEDAYTIGDTLLCVYPARAGELPLLLLFLAGEFSFTYQFTPISLKSSSFTG